MEILKRNNPNMIAIGSPEMTKRVYVPIPKKKGTIKLIPKPTVPAKKAPYTA